MLLYAFLVSTSFPVGKAITDQIDPVVVSFLRFLLATGAFLILLVLREKIKLPRPRDLGRYAIISFSIGAFFVLMFEALKSTTPVKTGAIFTLLPLISGLIGYGLMGIRVSGRQLSGLLIGSMGAIWVLFEGSLTALLNFDLGRGDYLFALGVLSFAAYAPLIKKLHRGESTVALTFWVVACGTVLLALYGAPQIVRTDWRSLDGSVYLAIAYLGLFNTAGTFFLAKFASVRLPPAKVMAYTYLTPGFVAALSVGSHGLPGFSVLAGIAVTIVAMVLLQRAN